MGHGSRFGGMGRCPLPGRAVDRVMDRSRLGGFLIAAVCYGFAPVAGADSHTGDALSAVTPMPPVNPLTQNLSSSVQGAQLDTILLSVDKSMLKAELRTWPENSGLSSILTTFKIAVGKADGDKEFEGDNRTPEGIYFVQNHIDGQTLPDKYGPLAIPIDFPNPIDQVSGKTGHGIWLHGVDREQRIEEAKVTEGCVAFYNNDIKILSNWLKSHQGIVVIAKDQKGVNQVEDISAIKKQTLDWIDAWAARNISAYQAFYSPSFRFAKYDIKGYIDYKKRVFAGYQKMVVLHDRLRIVTHPKYAVSFFNQDFRGDQHYVSIGRKVLYWEKDSKGEWKIQREVFENRRFEQLSLSDAELATALPERKPVREDGESKSSGSNL